MNYYALETQMWDRQREMLHDAEMRRLVAAANEPAEHPAPAPRLALVSALARSLRGMLAPGRSSRVEHPEFGDA